MIHISGHRWGITPECGYKDTENYLTVNCCGYEKYIAKDVKTLRKNGRADYQMIYIVKGLGYFMVDEKMTGIPFGNIVIFNPGEVQQYEYLYKDATELYWVHFTGYGARDFMDGIGLSSGRLHHIGLHNTCIEYFKKTMLELQLKLPLYEQTADAVLQELLAFIGRKKIAANAPNERNMDANIQNIMEQMHSGCNKQWNIEDMAKQCGLSPNRFMHKFKLQTGLPAMEYLIKIRIDKAKDLLLNSSLCIKEISDIIGYENPLYFSRLFRKMEGISPREYRNRHFLNS